LMPDGLYSGWVGVYRVLDGLLVQNISLNYSLSLDNGVVYVDPSPVTDGFHYNDVVFSKVVRVNNTGTYNLSSCSGSFTNGNLAGQGFVSFNFSNSTIPVGGGIDLAVVFSSVPAITSWNGYLQVDCVANVNGGHSQLDIYEQPLFTIVTSARPVVNQGGGGGGISETKVIVSAGNQSLFSVTTDTGSKNLQMFMYPSQTRDVTFIVESMIAESQKLSMVCRGDFCSHVSFSKPTFDLAGFFKENIIVSFDVPPEDVYGSSYAFDIVVADAVNHAGVVNTQIDVSKFSSYFSKFDIFVQKGDVGYWFGIGGVGIPKLILYLLLMTVSVLATYFMFPSGKAYNDIKVLTMTIAGIVVVLGASLLY